MRRKSDLLVLVLLFGAGVSIAAAENTHKPATQTWTTSFQRFGDYDPNFQNANQLVNFFTPATPIKVSRIEVKTAFGPYNDTGSSPVFCTTNPSVQITDGTHTYTLFLSNPTNADGTGGSATDSGSISVKFAAGARIGLNAIHGEPEVVGLEDACFTNSINVTVQYESPTGQD